MAIYITPFDDETKQATAHSVATAWQTLDDAAEVLGADWVSRHPRMIIYGKGRDRQVVSTFPFSLP